MSAAPITHAAEAARGNGSGGLRVISVQRAAERLDCSRHHVYRLIAAGKLRAVEIKVSGARPKTRVYPEDLDEFIEANTRTA